MIKSTYKVIGLMSGTSLDGLDLAYIEFNFSNKWSFKIIRAETISYTQPWKKILKNLVLKSMKDLKEIDYKYTSYLAKVLQDFINNNNIINLDAICSHGHTALHQPENKLTYQIGNQKILSSLTNQTIVCDFRVQDVEHGGQGAPLVPIGDHLLFSQYDYCINLGGFANISSGINGERIAYDICPLNIVFNYYSLKLGLDYDYNGENAASGILNQALLDHLNSIQYYNLNPPKSLGFEWVMTFMIPMINSYELAVTDILKTLVEHCAFQIVNEINKSRNASVLLTGGGTYNRYLVKRITELTSNRLVIPSKNLIEYKEALIFGLLGVLKLRGENNCLKSVTGAKNNHSSGEIYYP